MVFPLSQSCHTVFCKALIPQKMRKRRNNYYLMIDYINLIKKRMFFMLIKILQILKHDLREWIECIVAGWPETFLGKKMRIYYWSKKFNLKTKPVVGRGSKLYGPTIVIGNNFTCGEDVEINATKSNGVFIGNNVLMASSTYLRAANHHFESIDTPINQQ